MPSFYLESKRTLARENAPFAHYQTKFGYNRKGHHVEKTKTSGILPQRADGSVIQEFSEEAFQAIFANIESVLRSQGLALANLRKIRIALPSCSREQELEFGKWLNAKLSKNTYLPKIIIEKDSSLIGKAPFELQIGAVRKTKSICGGSSVIESPVVTHSMQDVNTATTPEANIRAAFLRLAQALAKNHMSWGHVDEVNIQISDTTFKEHLSAIYEQEVLEKCRDAKSIPPLRFTVLAHSEGPENFNLRVKAWQLKENGINKSPYNRRLEINVHASTGQQLLVQTKQQTVTLRGRNARNTG